MDRQQIDRFFKVIDAEFSQHAAIILTGAAAGTIWGSTRPSLNIDFAVKLKTRGESKWKYLESAVRSAIFKTGIQANYAEDIDRWGMITLLDYKDHATHYKKFGKLAVSVLEPAYWSIGKITRFINPDIDDMIRVFHKKKTPPAYLAQVWGKALRKSQRSTAIAQFRRHVESFLKSYGKKIWGRSFNSEKTITQFHKSAGIGK